MNQHGIKGKVLCSQNMTEQQRLEEYNGKDWKTNFLNRQKSCTCVFQMCTHLSKEPLARYLPSGLKATLYTGSWCFVRVWIQIPLSTSHNLTVESKDALSREKKKKQINYFSVIHNFVLNTNMIMYPMSLETFHKHTYVKSEANVMLNFLKWI